PTGVDNRSRRSSLEFSEFFNRPRASRGYSPTVVKEKISTRTPSVPNPKNSSAYEYECFRTTKDKRAEEPTPGLEPFPSQVHPGRGSRHRIYNRAATRAGWGRICSSQREDFGGVHWLRHAGNTGDAEDARDAGGANCCRLRSRQKRPRLRGFFQGWIACSHWRCARQT